MSAYLGIMNHSSHPFPESGTPFPSLFFLTPLIQTYLRGGSTSIFVVFITTFFPFFKLLFNYLFSIIIIIFFFTVPILLLLEVRHENGHFAHPIPPNHKKEKKINQKCDLSRLFLGLPSCNNSRG